MYMQVTRKLDDASFFNAFIIPDLHICPIMYTLFVLDFNHHQIIFVAVNLKLRLFFTWHHQVFKVQLNFIIADLFNPLYPTIEVLSVSDILSIIFSSMYLLMRIFIKYEQLNTFIKLYLVRAASKKIIIGKRSFEKL